MSIHKRLILILSLLSLALNASAREKLIITGSSTIAPLMNDIARLYEKQQSKAKHKIRIDVQTGGSSRGVLDVRKELSNIGMVSRKLKANEKDLFEFTIAKDGLAIIVHASNPITELTPKQIVDIYQGKIKNWKEVAGVDKKIVIVNKAEGRSTLELFLKFFKLKNSQIKADIIIGDNEQGIKTVSKNKNAIAYVSIGAAEYNASVGVPLKLLKFKGIEAKVENIKNKTYPLTRDLNIITKTKPIGKVKKFIDFVLSDKVTSLIDEHYFVPLNQK